MRLVKIFLFVLTVSVAAGCAYPRERFILERFQSSVPTITGGTIEYQVSSGAFVPELDTAYAACTVKSPRSPEEALAWYQQTLTNNGWSISKEALTESEQETLTCRLIANRNFWYGKEHLSVHFYRDKKVILHMQAMYLWDLPTACGNSIIIYPAIMIMSDGALVFYPILKHF